MARILEERVPHALQAVERTRSTNASAKPPTSTGKPSREELSDSNQSWCSTHNCNTSMPNCNQKTRSTTTHEITSRARNQNHLPDDTIQRPPRGHSVQVVIHINVLPTNRRIQLCHFGCLLLASLLGVLVDSLATVPLVD